MLNMKKYIYQLFVVILAFVTFPACTEDEGTMPGNDSNPVITIYKYKVSKPLNVDNDITLRFAANSPTTEGYYLVEKTIDRNAHIASLGEGGYEEYVVSNGIKLSGISGASNVDLTLTDLFGEYTITAVAVGAGTKTSATAVFMGLDWEDVASGTYHFSSVISGRIGMTSHPTTLQVCTTDDKLFRFRDVWGNGSHLKINLLTLKGNDADGEYTFFRVPATEMPFIYNSTYGSIWVRDIGYWQGSDVWVTENGYESGMYSDYSCFVYVQYYVYTSATATGNIGYNYDSFIPD